MRKQQQQQKKNINKYLMNLKKEKGKKKTENRKTNFNN